MSFAMRRLAALSNTATATVPAGERWTLGGIILSNTSATWTLTITGNGVAVVVGAGAGAARISQGVNYLDSGVTYSRGGGGTAGGGQLSDCNGVILEPGDTIALASTNGKALVGGVIETF